MTLSQKRANLYRGPKVGRPIMRVVDFAAIVSGLIAAVPFSAAADTVTLTYTFPSPLADYASANGASLRQINPALATLNSITLHATATATWSGGADTDLNEAEYVISLSGFTFIMGAARIGDGSAPASANFTETMPTALSAFTGLGFVDPSVSVLNQGGSPASISSTFGTESVTYDYTPASVPGEPIFPTPPTLTLSVPESSTWAMMLLGFAGLGLAAFRRTKPRWNVIVAAAEYADLLAPLSSPDRRDHLGHT
jgi:hypothetical protein